MQICNTKEQDGKKKKEKKRQNLQCGGKRTNRKGFVGAMSCVQEDWH